MKKIILILVIYLLHLQSFAQQSMQSDSAALNSNPLIIVEKPVPLKDIRLIANIRFASNNYFENNSFSNSRFQMNELRMEIVGKVTDKISIRIRDRYANNSTDVMTNDGLRHSVDLMYVDYQVKPTLTITGGKMISEWGSYELALNPVLIYAYNDMIRHGDFFLSGLKLQWAATKKHKISFQFVNSNSRSFQSTYGSSTNIETPKVSLGTTGNWRGYFMDGKFCTSWSYSIYNQSKGKYWQLLALGNQFKISNLTLQYDFKYSKEDLDKIRRVTNLLQETSSLKNVHYMEHWLRAEYFFAPKWSVTALGMSNSAYWKGNPTLDSNRSSLIRTQWTLTGALEYHLYKPHNTKIFASYVGRFNNYSKYAQTHFDLKNDNNGIIMIGILSSLSLF